MSTVQLILIALVQGITEFLPISSSGHLILISKLTDFPDQGLLIDVAVHVATLAAIMVYFARDVSALAKGAPLSASATHPKKDGASCIWFLQQSRPSSSVEPSPHCQLLIILDLRP